MEPKYIVAIEIGSSKIKGAIGLVGKDAPLEIIAVEEHDFIDGVRYGCIQNVEDVKQCVSSVISALEANVKVAPQKIKGVYVSLGGRSTMSLKRVIEKTFDEETEITRDIIDNLINQAYQEAPTDIDVVDIISLGYTVDNITPQNPIGTFGHSLKTTLNYITCRPQIMKNINRVIEERLPLDINGFIVRQIALSNLILTSDEKKLGCMLVDFGAETTSVSIHKAGALQYMATIPLGSRNITRDLTSLSITEEVAEKVKRNTNANPQETIGTSGKSTLIEGIDDAEVNNYVQYRSREIIANIINQIKLSGYKTSDLPNGIIIVGGGAKLKGFNSYLESQSGLKVRAGILNGNIRLLDTSINQADAIDVIAVLYAASQNNSIENCLDGANEIEIKPKDDDDVSRLKEGFDKIDNDIDDLDDIEDKKPNKDNKTRPAKPSILDKLWVNLEKLLKEDDDNGYEK